jgi:hypothetical protein
MIAIFLLSGCGEVVSSEDINIPTNTSTPTSNPTTSPTATSTPTSVPIPDDDQTGSLRIIGKITYDRVHVKSSGSGLDYNNVTKEPASQVLVKLVKSSCASNTGSDVIASASTNDSGEYEFTNLPKNQDARICVYAKMKKSGNGGWDVEVVDNTNSDALYIMQSSAFSTGESSRRRNLNASSGWDGRSYSGTRTAAPFAILGSIYTSMKKVINADPNMTFSKLKINWSKNNVPSGNGSEQGLRDGQIITSHYNSNGNLYILGDANSDTDEYDDHVMIHEWGHYFEFNFSRADSIGGPHTAGDRLDIRVAFSEGWGNAWSAIATDNPVYFDTQGFRQSDGFSMNIESDASNVAGWYSEDSVQHILYDLYDNKSDGADELSLGFKPIYSVLTGFQKNTEAFTSIFTFITGLQKENPSISSEIDSILDAENIKHVYDIYGSKQNNLYSEIETSGSICTSGRYGRDKLNSHKYIKTTLSRGGQHTITVEQNNGKGSDPDIGVYTTKPFKHIGDIAASIKERESGTDEMSAGDYLLDVSDYNAKNNACFDVTIN